MEDRNYTIKDIARMAGVSAGTAGRVPRDRGVKALCEHLVFKKPV